MNRDPKQTKAAAVKYQHGDDRAPRVVAKGKGALAEKILETARKHGIPIREDKTLVEILSSLELYEEIPPKLYKAVAEILAFIYAINGKAKGETR
ncbi:MAG: EscU/YscU/HrcU family type III secretion system export apparatus switch protein [Nitrospirae bacterium]|nr:EscU/YscU/HrcU family type III secretion system export apparatus switch protein [Nitrospirota bacterium]